MLYLDRITFLNFKRIMKKILLLTALLTMLSTSVIFGQTKVKTKSSTLPNETNWHATYQYDREIFLSSITQLVLSGKLKAYAYDTGEELTVKEFKDILFRSDTTLFADPNNPETIISAPVSTLNHKYYQIKCNEKIELDTLSHTLSAKISTITFFTYKYTETGKIVYESMRKLFDVKFNDLPPNDK